MRKRTWTYGWADLGYVVEVDYVCERCCTIVLNPEKGCQHCCETDTKKAERLAKFLEGRAT